MVKVAAARKLAVRLYWMLRQNLGYPEIARIESSSKVALQAYSARYYEAMNPTKGQQKPVRKEVSAKSWTTDNALTMGSLQVEARPEYVAWIDLMGARGWMAGSIRRAAEMIALIHVAGCRAARKHGVRSYPVIDGVYLVGTEKSEFRQATSFVMQTLAETFLSQNKPDRRFLARGGIAYGRVLHGEDITELHRDLKEDAGYTRCLALGIAIGQAYEAESKAPPFGYYVDRTARSTASANAFPYISSFFRWWSIKSEGQQAQHFGQQLDHYFEYLCSRRRELEYPEDRLKEHRALAKEYFAAKVDDITLHSDMLGL